MIRDIVKRSAAVNRRAFILLVCAALIMGLCSCGRHKGGKTAGAATREAASGLYTQDEIKAAIDTIKSEFEAGWKGCTLTEIYYAGDEISQGHQDWADRNGADEVIVLLSSFDTDSSGGDGSLNSNSTYDNWMWILVRTKGGKWQHVDHGY